MHCMYFNLNIKGSPSFFLKAKLLGSLKELFFPLKLFKVKLKQY